MISSRYLAAMLTLTLVGTCVGCLAGSEQEGTDDQADEERASGPGGKADGFEYGHAGGALPFYYCDEAGCRARSELGAQEGRLPDQAFEELSLAWSDAEWMFQEKVRRYVSSETQHVVLSRVHIISENFLRVGADGSLSVFPGKDDQSGAAQQQKPAGSAAAKLGLRFNGHGRQLRMQAYFEFGPPGQRTQLVAALDDSLDYWTIDIGADLDAKLSPSSIASVLFSVPPDLGGMLGAVLDRFGDVNLAANFVGHHQGFANNIAQTVPHQHFPEGRRTTRLAHAIAKDILRPACIQAATEEGLFDASACDINVPTEGAVASREVRRYRVMPLVGCQDHVGWEGSYDLAHLWADAPRPSSDEMIDFLRSSGSTPVKLFLYERTTENQWVQKNWVSLITREDGDSACSGIGQERRCAKVQLGELFAFNRTCANFADGKQYALSLADEPRIVVDPLDADYD